MGGLTLARAQVRHRRNLAFWKTTDGAPYPGHLLGFFVVNFLRLKVNDHSARNLVAARRGVSELEANGLPQLGLEVCLVVEQPLHELASLQPHEFHDEACPPVRSPIRDHPAHGIRQVETSVVVAPVAWRSLVRMVNPIASDEASRWNGRNVPEPDGRATRTIRPLLTLGE
ncbi:hypothetical protein LMG27952_07584 [Paraburkholderia hiiakae]|uniref:Uncharacterized protein n=1 Tax=Paraburkholderia hiiakae TaxID=1081782 RepID=A0ABN7IFQ7_9BURK|nr:hypothetical protein LMG27952_07584 [Paraburkholderia hiiakae]